MTNPELIPTKVYPTAAAASVAVAREIADLIRARAAAKKRCVLGLATGSSPMTVYAELVPRRALTMGVGTILESRRVILLAFGEHKAAVIARAIEGEITPHIPASYLQKHPDATVFLDEAAAAELTRFKSPWLLGPVDWDRQRVRK